MFTAKTIFVLKMWNKTNLTRLLKIININDVSKDGNIEQRQTQHLLEM